ncbi:DEAD/DEAH box helicase [Actinomycetospora lutea]|uniref:DEAD/DEAH box helicase n=1 Tax=Actinomycetospora lutea TaxID=663604 RepID=UPI002365E08D|nr:DEAD/DEAH box helicase [Actinomycetospora lutea]MDD7937798.1 DEAD/DEAH box helicase [Actinomycetospora lutea]
MTTITPDNPTDEEPVAEPLKAGAPVTEDAPTFAELGVDPAIVSALAKAGIERTFAIQELTLPLALAGEDVIGQARTGTGKTLGFGVPLLQRLGTPGDGTPQALVVVPTRELCVQVAKDIEGASANLGTRVVSIYGGRPYEGQIAALQRGVDFVVGTPGRLLDLAQQGHLVLAKVGGLVLDEADEMLDLGFLPDVERILGMLPERRQTMLFSATMPGPIITLARTFLTQPTHIRAEQVDASAIGEKTAQFVYRAHALDKVELLARTLQATDRGPTMVFTRTKRTASKVSEELAERGFAVGAVHGDLGQGAREHALKAFRDGRIDVLVCTDVAARGIDVTGVTHVINYQCPDDAKTYIHRIGRTGRAGLTGIAVTLVDWDDLPKWKMISDDLGLGAPEPPETYSSSPHLFADLGIPEGATGRVARRRRPAEEEAEDGPKRESTDRGRSRGRSRGGRGNGDAGSSDETPDEGGDTPRRGRSSRSRTRRRNGEVVAGPEAEGSGEGTGEGSGEATGSTGTPDAGERHEETSGEGEGGRRRRRRRGGRGSGASRGSDGAEAPTSPETADAVAASTE